MYLNEDPPCTIRVSIADMMALRVRAQGNNSPSIRFLYQGLPAGAMTLMATLPRGDTQVSIPHRRDLAFGYSIEKTFPQVPDGFVLVYTLRPNRRYEAVRASFQGRDFEIAEFCEFAAQWAGTHYGQITGVPGRYAYLAPAIDQWGVILRDDGYLAADPSKLQSGIAAAMSRNPQRHPAGGILMRIPVHKGEKQPAESAVPVFSRVELTFDPVPGERSNWLSFDEYRALRLLQSRPSESMIGDFHEWMDRLAEECGFESWDFPPGTLFSDRIEWWGNRNRRRTEHEGIDFALGRKPDARTQNIPPGAPVRAVADGEIVNVLADFLDRTVVVRHPAVKNDNSDIFYTLYSHIQPVDGLRGPVSKGQLLGRIGRSKSNRAPMHLHLTAAWIPESLPPAKLVLGHIHPAFTPVILVNLNSSLK